MCCGKDLGDEVMRIKACHVEGSAVEHELHTGIHSVLQPKSPHRHQHYIRDLPSTNASDEHAITRSATST